MTPTELHAQLVTIDEGNRAYDRLLGIVHTIHKIARKMVETRSADWDVVHEYRYGMGIDGSIFQCRGHVSKIRLDGTTSIVHARVRDEFRGEVDYSGFDLPYSWLTMTEPEVTAALTTEFDDLFIKARGHKEAKAQRIEAERRAEYERMKAEFEPPTDAAAVVPK